ncbi:Ger(x)C family spore germination protein [Paenibacillaceae bacterium WGS1546]|uniref:Ger(x)C family spore germination protein n=1 Tax=Cohnella sp. WGS1546 TaxID=3366810 RepID=UPI00372D4FDC
MCLIKRAALWVMLCSALLMAGCSPYMENNTIEEIAPVIFWSINDGGDGQLQISTLVPPLTKEKKRLLTLKVELLKQGRKDFNLIYYRELKAGQLRMILINEELAKKGIVSLINTLLTDPDISQRLYVVIVQGNFEDYLKNQLDKQENIDYFLYRMFKHYEQKNQGEMTIVNLHQFLKKLYSPYSDPILPVFKAGKDHFTYEGTALFRDDKMIATVRNMDDQVMQLIDNDHYLKLLSIPSLSVALGHVRSKVHIELNRNKSTISITTDLIGILEEYRGDKYLGDHKELAILNREIESYLEKQTKEMLEKMQKWKVDPLQLGTLTLKPFMKPISEKEWSSDWEAMKIDVNFRVQLSNRTFGI